MRRYLPRLCSSLFGARPVGGARGRVKRDRDGMILPVGRQEKGRREWLFQCVDQIIGSA